MENMEITTVKIELLNDVDINDIAINLEYNIVIIGKEGKLLIKNYLIIIYYNIFFKIRCWKKNIIKLYK